MRMKVITRAVVVGFSTLMLAACTDTPSENDLQAALQLRQGDRPA